jgi:hypothetical protein
MKQEDASIFKLVATAGSDYKFVGRQDVKQRIVEHFQDRIKNIGNVDKNVTSLLYVTGCPGVGKSKVNVETRSILIEACHANPQSTKEIKSYLDHSRFINITYDNDIMFMPFETDADDCKREHSLCVRILYFYIKPNVELVKFAEAFTNVRLSILVTIEYIARREKVRHVHIGVDGYNKLIQRARDEKGKEFAHVVLRGLIYQLKSGMGRCVIPKSLRNMPLSIIEEEHLLVTVMMSGTVRNVFGSKLSGPPNIDTISLKQFELDDILNLIASELKEEFIKERLATTEFIQALSILGFLPSTTETVIEYLRQYPKASSQELITSVNELLSTKYSLTTGVSAMLSNNGMYKIIQHCILREQPHVNTLMEGESYSLTDMETNGFIVLEYNETSYGYRLDLPYTWLLSFAKHLERAFDSEKLFPGAHELVQALDALYQLACVSRSTASYHFETFCSYYEFAYIKLFYSAYRMQPRSFKELWPKVEVYDAVFYEKFDWHKLVWHSFASKYPSIETKYKVPECCFGLNVQLSEMDAVARLSKNSISSRHYRHTLKDYLSPNVTPSLVEEQVTKVEKVLQSTGFEHKGLVFVTNQPLSEEMASESYSHNKPIAIIHRNNMNNYFIPAIVLFLQNLGTICINFASKEELAKITGVGASTAERIIESRDKHGVVFRNIPDVEKHLDAPVGMSWKDVEHMISFFYTAQTA